MTKGNPISYKICLQRLFKSNNKNKKKRNKLGWSCARLRLSWAELNCSTWSNSEYKDKSPVWTKRNTKVAFNHRPPNHHHRKKFQVVLEAQHFV